MHQLALLQLSILHDAGVPLKWSSTLHCLDDCCSYGIPSSFLSLSRQVISMDLVHLVGHSPIFNTLLQTEGCISPTTLTNSAGF